jgi:hypothetical protein
MLCRRRGGESVQRDRNGLLTARQRAEHTRTRRLCSSCSRSGLWSPNFKVRREGERVIPPELRNRHVGGRKRQACCVCDIGHVKARRARAIEELEDVPHPEFVA